MRLSLTTKLLGGIVATIVVLAAIATFFAIRGFSAQHEALFAADFEKAVENRAEQESNLFRDIRNAHLAADVNLERKAAALDPEEAAALFDRYFPLQADGTRRSLDILFEGGRVETIGEVYGVGAFFADGAALTTEDKVAIWAAFEVVAESGQALFGQFSNFIFATPNNGLMIFGPTRSDRLVYYRKEAPADFSFSHLEMSQMMLPENNPQGATRCTELTTLLSDSNGVELMTGCYTPIRVDGRHLGSWGVTVKVSGLFRRAVTADTADATNMIITADGRLFAHPELADATQTDAEKLAALSGEIEAAAISARIRESGARSGIIRNLQSDQIIAYSAMEGPDWYYVVTRPRSTLTAAAFRTVRPLLFIWAASGLAAIMVLIVLSRRLVLNPVKRLAARYGDTVDGAGEVEHSAARAVEEREDEIGQLARALRRREVRVSDTLATLEQRVAERTSEIQKANAAKSEFLAHMSHEIRTPMNGVLGMAGALEQTSLDGRQKQIVSVINQSGRALMAVIDDILDLSKVEAGKLTLERTVFQLGDLLDSVADLNRERAEQKGLALSVSLSDSADGDYLGDPTRLRQILNNLVSNALKFTEQGEIAISADRTGEGADTTLHFSVRDTGVGIKPDARDTLFTAFSQADASTTRKYGGTGLGLAICKQLCERMGGSISVDSAPGEGAEFRFHVKMEPRCETGREQRNMTREGAMSSSDRPLRVLAADDHPVNRMVIEALMEAAGVELTMAENGVAAVEAWENGEFDIVLMDIQMPEMDGIDATREIRRKEAERGHGRTPIIALTANAMTHQVSEYLEAGMDDHVAKPVSAAALSDAMQRALENGSGGESEVRASA